MSGPELPQRWRVIILLVYLALSLVAHLLVTGAMLPGSGPESVWFYSAMSMWTLNLLAAPWFKPPRDSLSSALASALILATLDLPPTVPGHEALSLIRAIAVGFCLLVAISALCAMFLADADQYKEFAQFCYRFSDAFGRGEVMFTPGALVGVFVGYHSEPVYLASISSVWIAIITAHPLETVARLWIGFNQSRKRLTGTVRIGRVIRVDHPNLVRIVLESDQTWTADACLIVRLADRSQHLLLPLYAQLQGDHVLATALRCEACDDIILGSETGFVYRWLLAPRTVDQLKDGLCGQANRGDLIGIVVEGSSIDKLRVEISGDAGVEEGSIVFTRSNDETVFFQVLSGETAEETMKQNPTGKQIAVCAQIGVHRKDSGFRKHPWLPPMNQPVFLAPFGFELENALTPEEFCIGALPNSQMHVVAHLKSLIDHHTAVLGVTGTGKTELVLDVIREALARGTKVFCVDFTGEYRPRLADANPIEVGITIEQGSTLEELLFAVESGQYGAGPEKKRLKEFVDAIQAQVGDSVEQFLTGEEQLGLLELAEVTNTKATLRVTELFLSAVMIWARQNRKRQRVLIVLEEAHTIIPETAGGGFDFETQWVVSRIGQIALQGRKYGVGLLVVSQRTALVSKTILSQCNTFLVHSLIDQTSLSFLGSVFGTEHVRAIPNLRFLQFMAYGKGIRSERPVLLTRKYDAKKYEASLALDYRGKEKHSPPPADAGVIDF